jgi:hypothetical protein
MIKVELIQASINLANGVIIYTFDLSFPKRRWYNCLGFHSGKTLSAVSTFIRHSGTLFLGVKEGCDPRYFDEVIDRLYSLESFARKVLTAIYNKRTVGRITSADAQRAQELFGSRVQNVLKQYKVGELHQPFGETTYDNRFYTHEGIHDFVATKDGWRKA